MAVTLFSVPKAFIGHIGTIQRNAITSWTQLRPRPEVILLGNEDGIAEIAADLGVRHIRHIQHNEQGTPLLSSLFEAAQMAAAHEMLCYLNADIILLSDFARMTARIGRGRSVVVGRRTDIDFTAAIDFTDEAWETRMRTQAACHGRLHGPRAHDYFLFSRDVFRQVPPFAVGRLLLDNWLIYDAKRRGMRVIDATRVVTAIHQNHDSSHLRLPDGRWNWDDPEIKRNVELAGGPDLNYNISDCTHLLRPIGTWPAIWPEYLQQRLQRPPFVPPSAGLRPRLMRIAIVGVLRAQGVVGRSRETAKRMVRAFGSRPIASR